MSTFSDFISQRIQPPEYGDLQTGQWYSNFSIVYNYAMEKGIAMMVMRTGSTCTHCDKLETSLTQAIWKNWMNFSNVLFYVATDLDKTQDDKPGGTADQFLAEGFKRLSSRFTLPVIRFYWYDPKTNEIKIDYPITGDTLDENKESNAEVVIAKCEEILKTYYVQEEVIQKYYVIFKDYDKKILKGMQYVESGKDAVPPSDPERTGFIFKGWKPSYTNIQKNTTCIAQYSEKVISESPSIIPVPNPEESNPGESNPEESNPENPNYPVSQNIEHQIFISNNVTDWSFIGNEIYPNGLRQSLKTAVIGSSCQKIEASCFINCENLESVFLDSRCRNIEDYAFYGCKKLKYITCLAPNSYSMNYLGNHAFDGCDSLQEIYLNLSSSYYAVGIGDSCFANCRNLIKMYQYNSSFLGSNMFSGCQSLGELEIPLNTNYVFPSALANIPNIRSITIPNSIWFLNDYMFKDDKQLTNVNIVDLPGSRSVMNLVGKNVFDGCSKLTSIILPKSINALSCIDDGFLAGSSIRKVVFNGLSDDVFANKDKPTINLGNYQTGKSYCYYNDIVKVMELADRYHIPVIGILTNKCINDPNSPDYGYTLKGNIKPGTCSHCNSWENDIETQQKWQDFVKSSGYFWVKGGYGPFGDMTYDGTANKKKIITSIYRELDAGKAADFVQAKVFNITSGTYLLLGIYWNKENGTIFRSHENTAELIGGSSKMVDPKIQYIKTKLKDYTGENLDIKYEINEKLTTFGLQTSCLYVSSSGKEYICSNNNYIEYQPTVQVDMYEKTDFRYGTWYYNAKELREFADQYNIPVLIEYSSEGCEPCQYFKRNVFNNSDFQKWVSKSNYLFCRIETQPGEDFDHEMANPQAYYVHQVWAAESPNYKKQGIPVFMWYWKKNSGQPDVWDISSYHFPASEVGAQPPWTMQELMDITDGKFAGYNPENILNRHEIQSLYSIENILVGRIYENVEGDTDGRYFSCLYKKDIGDGLFSKTINIKGYSGPFPSSIRKNQEVQFRPATYQYYSSPSNAQYRDETFCIFRVDSIDGKNVISYVLSGYNIYEDEPTITVKYRTDGYIYKLSSDSDVELFEDIIDDGELTDTRTVVFCLDSSSNSSKIEDLLSNDAFKETLTSYFNKFYMVVVKPSDWNSRLGQSLAEFVNDEHRNTTAYDEAGFQQWNADKLPIIYLYLGCASCVLPGMRPSVEVAKIMEFEEIPESSSAFAEKILEKFKLI